MKKVVFLLYILLILQSSTLRSQTIEVNISGRITTEFIMPTSNFFDDGAWLYIRDVATDSTDSSLTLDFQINQTIVNDTLIAFINLGYYNSLIDSNNFIISYDPGIFSYFEFTFGEFQDANGILITAVLVNKIPKISFELILTQQHFILDDNILEFLIYTNIPRGDAAWFPLKEGNTWEYNEYIPVDSTYSDFQYEITDSMFIISQSYYEVIKRKLSGGVWDTVSVDTITIDDNNNIVDQNNGYYFWLLPTWIQQFHDYIQYEQLLNKIVYRTEFYDAMPGTQIDGFAITDIGVFDFDFSYIGFPPYIDIHLKGVKINNTVVYGTISDVEPILLYQPSIYLFYQNYPNPFNPSTTIKYQLPEIGLVTLKVYDILGSEIVTLVNEEKQAGSYEVQFSSHSVERRNLTSGIYFYQLKAGEYSETKKMILLK